ncbi:DUF3388 domain-containing protein, partial [Staphylococcus epidermidis]|uniref:DUF3388 domain-containing protein n=1 Tax=Staphylococcus epidermidis TaxID=1282 RepID=UPI0011A7E45D
HQLQNLRTFQQILKQINQIQITNLTVPQLPHTLPLPHPTYIQQDPHHKNTFKFQPQDLPLLVHFLPHLFKQEGHK